MKKIDDVHEEFRSPSLFMANKASCMKASWMGLDARHAMKPEGFLSLVGGTIRQKALLAAATAALVGVAMARS